MQYFVIGHRCTAVRVFRLFKPDIDTIPILDGTFCTIDAALDLLRIISSSNYRMKGLMSLIAYSEPKGDSLGIFSYATNEIVHKSRRLLWQERPWTDNFVAFNTPIDQLSTREILLLREYHFFWGHKNICLAEPRVIVADEESKEYAKRIFNTDTTLFYLALAAFVNRADPNKQVMDFHGGLSSRVKSEVDLRIVIFMPAFVVCYDQDKTVWRRTIDNVTYIVLMFDYSECLRAILQARPQARVIDFDFGNRQIQTMFAKMVPEIREYMRSFIA